jgi:hypothetical protein
LGLGGPRCPSGLRLSRAHASFREAFSKAVENKGWCEDKVAAGRSLLIQNLMFVLVETVRGAHKAPMSHF